MDDAGDAPLPSPKIGQAASKVASLGSSYLDFAKEFYADAQDRQSNLDAVTGQVVSSQLGAQDTLNSWASADRNRLETVFQPLQDQYISDAQSWDSPERQAEAAAGARGDVLKAAASQDAARQRQQAGMGINPNSGRWAGADRAGDTAIALGAAGAENKARSDLRLQGMGLRASAIGMGSGLASQAAGELGAASSIGSAATANTAAANAANNSTLGIMQSGTGTAMQGYGTQASILSGLYNSQLNAWSEQNKAAAQSNGDIMGALGLGAGLIFKSDENAKQDKKPATGLLEAVREMPVEEWTYKPGMGDGGRHIGTYAQDFKRATGKGDGRSIPVIDAIGVTMGAVKELDAKVDALARGLPAFEQRSSGRATERGIGRRAASG